MSYASGMAIGLTIGQQIFKLFAQNAINNDENIGSNFTDFNQELKKQGIKLAHALKGRRRYYIDALKQNERLAKILSLKLKELPYIKEVTANINTGSLLILYNCAENIIDDIFCQLQEKVFNLKEKISQVANSSTTILGNTIILLIKDINEWVRNKTNNLLDLKVLVSSIFIIRGIRKILMLGQRPNGPQMLWWAFSILRGLSKK